VRVGYARVLRQDQRLEPQRDALLADGCERVFQEKVSSREAERKALHEAFDYCREGDVLVVARLDRLGRSLRELIDLVRELEERGVGFRSLKESLDTTTAGGRLIFHVFGALAEFEREIVRERTMRDWKRREPGAVTAVGPGRSTITRRSWREDSRRRASTQWRSSARCLEWGDPPCTGTSAKRKGWTTMKTEERLREAAIVPHPLLLRVRGLR
jgi:DNA invertase Pin-like site-specific DNA recombinase